MSSNDEKTFQEKVNEIKDTDEIKREETILNASDKTSNAKIRFQEKRLERKKSRNEKKLESHLKSAEKSVDKALKDGISYEVAKSLCVQAIIGSAKMIANTDKSIDELIKAVCSPKGATLEGLKVFEQYHTNVIIEEVADATIKRAYELSKI